MNVYEYLGQIRRTEYRVKNAEREIERLKTLAQSAGAMDYSVEIVQNGKATQEPSFVHTLEQLNDKMEKLQKVIADYNDLRSKIFEQIDALTPLQSRVLYLKFFEYKNIDKIARDINYSYYGARAVFRGAIRAFQNKYGEEFTNE